MLSSEPDSDLFTFNTTTSGGGGEGALQSPNTAIKYNTEHIHLSNQRAPANTLAGAYYSPAVTPPPSSACGITLVLSYVMWWTLSSDAPRTASSLSLFFLICPQPRTIKKTTLNHKLIVLAAQTFLRGSACAGGQNNLIGWGKPQVGGDKERLF